MYLVSYLIIYLYFFTFIYVGNTLYIVLPFSLSFNTISEWSIHTVVWQRLFSQLLCHFSNSGIDYNIDDLIDNDNHEDNELHSLKCFNRRVIIHL